MNEIRKKIMLVMIPVSFLTGCLNTAYNDAVSEVSKAESSAKVVNEKYKSIVDESIGAAGNLIDEKVLAGLNDPFRIKDFVNPPVAKATKGSCANGATPPASHKRSYLEGYSLSALSFVGMIGKGKSVALVRTPNHGVVSVKIGDYIGNKDGVLSAVSERKMIVVEKVRQGCLWVDLATPVSLK